MIELLHWSNQESAPSIFKRLADITVNVNYNFAMGKTPIGRKAYFECSNENYSYNLDTFELLPVSALRNRNRKTQYGSAVVVGNLLYIVGSSGQPVWAPAIFNPAANSWSTLNTGVSGSNDSFYVTDEVGAYVGGNLVQLGGTYAGNNANTNIVVIPVVAKTWNSYSLANVVRNAKPIAGEPIGNLLYVLCANGALYRGSVGTASASWSGMASAPQAPNTTGVRCVTYANKLYFYGGDFGKNLRCYDPSTNSWSVIGNGGPGGQYPGICLDGSLLYIFSGYQVWTVELDSTKWE